MSSVSLKYSPSPSISFPPYTSPSSAGEKLKHHFKPALLFALFGARAPEVLHSVRTCNVNSISGAIRPHSLYQTCLSVIPPPLSPSSMTHPHTWPHNPPPSSLCFCSAIPPLILSFLLTPPFIRPPFPSRSLALRLSTHLTTPASFLLPLPLPPSTSLHSTPIPSLAPRGALQTAYSTIGRHKDM